MDERVRLQSLLPEIGSPEALAAAAELEASTAALLVAGAALLDDGTRTKTPRTRELVAVSRRVLAEPPLLARAERAVIALAPAADDLYARALAIAAHVDHVIEHVPGRYRLRQQLDAYATEIAVHLSRAAHEPRALRGRLYRAAQSAAASVAALLDVLDVQLRARDHRDTLDAARIAVRVLLAELGPYAHGTVA